MNNLKSNSLISNNTPAGNDISVHLDINYNKYMRLGWLVLVFGLAGFLLWASLAPLDKGVPMSGTVAVATNKKAIQHETGGTVEAILVKEGDAVKAGDVLLLMNNVQSKADAESTRVQYITARTMQARLLAEQSGNHTNVVDKFAVDSKDSRVLTSIAIQEQIALSKQAALKSELAAIDQSIFGLVFQIEGLKASIKNKQQQQKLLIEQTKETNELAQEGYVASNRVSELEQNLAKLNADLASDEGSIGRYRAQVSELKLQKLQRKQEYENEINIQLSDAQKQADALENQLKGLDRNVINVEVKAPVDGTVVGLSVFTKGAVVAPGFKLMDILPKEDNLVVDGRLPVHLVDKVYANLPVNLMFTAFNQNKTPYVPGVVTHVSADRFEDERTGEPYYKVVAKVAPEGIKLISDLKILPGMPVDMFVKTGERTMMNYLFKPILDHLKLSMSEE